MPATVALLDFCCSLRISHIRCYYFPYNMAAASRKLVVIGTFFAGSLIYLFCLAYLQPTFSDTQYRVLDRNNPKIIKETGKYEILPSDPKVMGESSHISKKLPLGFDEQPALVEITMKMHARTIHPRIFEIKTRKCLIEIDVNAEVQRVEDDNCLYPFSHHIKFPSNYHEGENFVVLITKHRGRGGIIVNASYKDPIVFGVHVLYLLFLCFIAFLFVTKFRKKESRILFCIVFMGILLRCVYLIGTPFLAREYDTFGHLQYIRYLHQHWFYVPLANAGWEYSQPPLYYWLASLFAVPAKIFGTDMMVISSLRIFSLVLSILVLLTSVWLAQMLFKERGSSWKKYIFVSVFAVLPGIVFLSSRVTNDSMVLLVGMLFFAFLLRWWKAGKTKDLYFCFIFLGLCMLTKNNCIALIPVVLITILLKKKISWRLVIKYYVICAVIISLMVGWLYTMRMMQQGEFKVVGNVHMVNKRLQVDIKPSNFTQFNLSEVLRIPYHNAWDDEARRMIYWEVLIKSVFTGEWNMGDRVHSIARVIHTINFVLLLVVILAIANEIVVSPRKNVPLWALLVFLISTQIGLVALEKFNGLQKFRYVTLLTIPVTYYFVVGLNMLNPRIRRILLWLFWFFAVLCIMLMFVVIYSNKR